MTIVSIEKKIMKPETIFIPFLLEWTEKHEQTNDAIDNAKPGNPIKIPNPDIKYSINVRADLKSLPSLFAGINTEKK